MNEDIFTKFDNCNTKVSVADNDLKDAKKKLSDAKKDRGVEIESLMKTLCDAMECDFKALYSFLITLGLSLEEMKKILSTHSKLRAVRQETERTDSDE
ncbi:MAG: hypothetical protein IJ583_11470 [Firmicutes bacterium]|nr:hypothetical protein [Bacillota bacterium]